VADSQFFTQESAIAKATEIKTALAASKLWLFKSSLTPTPATTAAELEAAECDFDGYTPGGYALAAWTGPLNAEGGGAVITSPLVNVSYNTPSDPPVTNMVGGWFVEDASGDVRVVGIFDPPRPCQEVGDGFSIVVQDVEGRNATS